MPKSPKRPCRYCGCPNLTDDKTGYCDEHKAIARRKYDKYERSADVRKQYGHSWEKIRNKFIMLHASNDVNSTPNTARGSMNLTESMPTDGWICCKSGADVYVR